MVQETLLIDCDECVLHSTDSCEDCVVTHLLGAQPNHPVVVELAEARALRELDRVGLAPPLRHRPRSPRRTG